MKKITEIRTPASFVRPWRNMALGVLAILMGKRNILIQVMFWALSSPTLAAQLESIDFNKSAQQYKLFEIRFQLKEAYSNPFDPSEIDIWAHVTAPSGKTEMRPAFWA